MNDLTFSEDDFCIILLIFGSVGIVISAVLFFLLDLKIRRSREMRILRTSSSIPEANIWDKPRPEKTKSPRPKK
jgi:hypothetical protein